MLGAVGYFSLRPPPVNERDFTVIDKSHIAQILLRQDGQYVQILRGSKGWALSNADFYPVSSVLVERLIDDLQSGKSNGVQAWGEEKILASGLSDGNPGICRVQLRDANNQILNDWLIGQKIGEAGYLARTSNGDQIIHWAIAEKPMAKAEHWLANIWMGLDRGEFQSIIVGLGEEGMVELRRQNMAQNPSQQAWTIANLPPQRELRADSTIVRLPSLWRGQTFVHAKPVGNVATTSPLRWYHQFILDNNIQIRLTQAAGDNVIWTHFTAQSADPAREEWVSAFNAAHSPWLYQMPPDFNRLLSLRMGEITQVLKGN